MSTAVVQAIPIVESGTQIGIATGFLRPRLLAVTMAFCIFVYVVSKRRHG